uniref:Engulfment and cell motility 3 n=1 Tax=Chelonoidis abingdonii TaxID=106734 RepID=A0A8C0G7W6_CHEAB
MPRPCSPHAVSLCFQTKPLAAVVKEVCDVWNLGNAEHYALQYVDGQQTYITESNRAEIKNGSILRLTTSPDQEAERLLSGIQSHNLDVKADSLKKLANLSRDITFAQEFINRNGLKQMPLQYALCMHCIIGEILAHTLKAFMELMEHDFVSWETLSPAFIKKIVRYALTFSVHPCLALSERNIRQFIHKVRMQRPMGDEMAHYLYVLQSITLNLLERRMRTPMDPYSQEQRELLQFLRHSAFELESEPSAGTVSAERRRSVCVTEFRKLGFQNYSNPAQDLHRTPPGLLALDNMVYFSRHCPSAYSRFVLENSSRDDKHECPFARSSIQLTLALCEILHVGEPCSETAQAFYLMFFGQDHFFQELFCICIQLQNKTWKEMRATQEDFDKVLQVVREQITRTLSLKPTSLELFKTRVNALNYSEILRLRQTERMHQEETLAAPVLELRERLKPELLQLIRQQRLLRLCEGTLFRKISSRRRQDKLWYCRLSPNHKVLHYGDVEQGVQSPPIESLPEKIPVADIKELLVGRECPHMKEKGSGKHNKDVLDLAFSISYDVEEYYLNFIAPTRYEFCLWMDGLNVLLGREMTSERTQSELDILLSMELKLRLLDLENISIPDAPPPVPNPPSNLNFCYDFSPHEQ